MARWGVWLGRHTCDSGAQVSKGELSGDRNPTWSRRAKAHLIHASSAGVDRESAAYRSLGRAGCVPGLNPWVSEKLPQG